MGMPFWGYSSNVWQAFTKNYNSNLTVLYEIIESKIENGDTKYNAKLLKKNMLKRETGY